MCDQQLDLFSSSDIQAERPLPQSMELRPTATALDDQALIAAIPKSNLADSIALATEAGRRRLAAAVPSLEALCRRFSGLAWTAWWWSRPQRFGHSLVISGRDAALAVSRLIVQGAVQGPALNLAVRTAARIGSTLPADVLRSLLRHPEPAIRANVWLRAPAPRTHLGDDRSIRRPESRRSEVGGMCARTNRQNRSSSDVGQVVARRAVRGSN
jgi:hypothetical protein